MSQVIINFMVSKSESKHQLPKLDNSKKQVKFYLTSIRETEREREMNVLQSVAFAFKPKLFHPPPLHPFSPSSPTAGGPHS